MILQTALQFYATGINNGWCLGIGLDPNVNKNISSFRHSIYTPQQDFVSLSVGNHHTIALDRNNQLYGWGENIYGQLTNEYENYVKTPTKINYFSTNNIKISQIQTSGQHSLVLAHDGKMLYSFGFNGNSQLGRNVSKNSEKIPGLVNLTNLQKEEYITQIQSNTYSSFILTNKGTIYLFGLQDKKIIPYALKSCDIKIPTKLNISFVIKQIYITDNNFWFIDSQNDVYSLGNNQFGQLCTGQVFDNTNVPTKTQFKDIQKIVSQISHTIILKQNKAYGCGKGDDGALGEVTKLEFNPVPLRLSPNLGNIFDTAVTTHGSILLADNGLYASGFNQYGELSLDTYTRNYHQFTNIIYNYEYKKVQTLYSSGYTSFIIDKP